MITQLKRWMITMTMRLLGLFPIQNNKIVFCSYHGSNVSCNPKFIYEALIKKNSNLDYVWILPEDYDAPKGVRVIQERSLKGLYELATAKVWVDNSRKSIWMVKRKQQYYIQSWHAGISNKLGEGSSVNELPKEYVDSAINDSKMADLFLSNSKWESDNYRNVFWYDGEILEEGLPREDILVANHEPFHQKVCEYYGCPLDTKFVLYAPTFRNSGDLSVYDIDYDRLLANLGPEWKVIIRLHPNIQHEQAGIVYNNHLLNGSAYAEINDLILASDYMISDYSSCLFDGMLAGLKVLVYASDIEAYRHERGFAFSWDEMPFDIASNNDELEKCITLFNQEKYTEKVEAFKEKCGVFEMGHASMAVANRILEVMHL